MSSTCMNKASMMFDGIYILKACSSDFDMGSDWSGINRDVNK